MEGLLRPDEAIPSEEPSEEPEERINGYADWLALKFPHVATAKLSRRHERLWNWFESLEPEKPAKTQIEVWPRGGAKSSTAELGCAYLERKLSRRFILYVSATQDQADLHVRSIATLLESLGVERAIGRYGASKGWRRDQLITASGFAVAAYGLDTASRGVKIEQFRPDLIIFDDIDDATDTGKAVKKKKDSITKSVLPTGSPWCAYLVVQNLIHEDSIVAQLVDGRADFLLDRTVPEPEPAVKGLVTTKVEQEDGSYRYQIVEGQATWQGQSLQICEQQINSWGLKSFLEESQHEVGASDGYFFDHVAFQIVEHVDMPIVQIVRTWDLAATQDGGDYTVGVLMALAQNRRTVFVLDVFRAQLSSEKVRAKIDELTVLDKQTFPLCTVRIPQDPGQAGKAQAEQLEERLKGFGLTTEQVTGKKAVRARGWADRVNSGNVRLIRAPWNRDYIEEHRKFREDEEHEFDDQVDASADGSNEFDGATSFGMAYKKPDSAAANYRPR